MRALKTLTETLKRLGHGGNHHPAANYNLSLYNKKRYSSSMDNYRRGGSLKKYQDEGQVEFGPQEENVSEEQIITPQVATPVVANTQTEIPNVVETDPVVKTETKGEGVHGRQLYDGPLKDLNVHHFFNFVNEDGLPELSYRPEWLVRDGNGNVITNEDGSPKLDPEVDKWRSKKRGLSVSEMASWYISTQLNVPQDAYDNGGNNSNWQGQNYGKIRHVKFDDNGTAMFDNNGRLMFEDFNSDKHDEFMEKALAGDPAYSWYPTDFDNAFAMAHDMKLPYFFYNGEPFHGFTEEQTDKWEADQIEAERIAKEKWIEHHSANPSEQFNTWFETKSRVHNDEGDKVDAWDMLNLDDISEETMIYMQVNHPEMFEFIDPNFDTEEDALRFLQYHKGNPYGGAVKVNGKEFLIGEKNREYIHWSDRGDDYYDLTGTYYDDNAQAYGQKIENDWHHATTLTNTQELHNKTAGVDGDLSEFRGTLTEGSPMMMDYQDGVDWLNQFDPNGRMYNWKTSYTNGGNKYIEFLPMVDAYEEGAQDKWLATLDHSSYEPNYIRASASNAEDILSKFPQHSWSSGDAAHGYYTNLGWGSKEWKVDGEKINNPNEVKMSHGYGEMESLINFENVVGGVIGGKFLGWAGKGVGRYLGLDKSGTALKGLWSEARHPFKVGGKDGVYRTFKNGAWQFTKNSAATVYQPVKHLTAKYQNSWLNRKIMSPSIPGTYGVANGNTLFNAHWANESYKAAKQDFAEGDYIWGTVNTALIPLNVFQPYRRYKNFKLIDESLTKPGTISHGIVGKDGFLQFNNKFKFTKLDGSSGTGINSYFGEINKLPSSRLRNYYSSYFGFKPTQTSVLKDFNKAKDAYISTHKTQQHYNLLKFNPK